MGLARRTARGLGCAALVTLALTGCGSQVTDGHALAGAAVSSAAPSTPSATSAPVASPSPVSSAASSASSLAGPSNLLALVEAAPANSRAGVTKWDMVSTPSSIQFVHEFYDKSQWTYATARLRGQGLVRIAHRVWTTTRSIYADMVLLEFSDPTGAQSRFIQLTAAEQADPTLKSATIGGRGNPIAFYAAKLDKYGNTAGQVNALVGTVMIELHTFSPGGFDRTDAQNWILTQIARLP